MTPIFQEYSKKIDEIFGVMVRVCFSLPGQINNLEKLVANTGVPFDTTLTASSFSNSSGNPIHSATVANQIESMEEGGFDEILIGNICASFIYSLWEDKYREDFARHLNIEKNRIKSDFFYELSTYRHSIIHNQSLGTSKTAQCLILPKILKGKPLQINRHVLELIVKEANRTLCSLSLPSAIG